MGACINSFCNANLVKLNSNKTEAVSFSIGSPPHTIYPPDCLRYYPFVTSDQVWCLVAIRLVPEQICRRQHCQSSPCLFAAGFTFGTFHGKLNPLSIFVIPVLLSSSVEDREPLGPGTAAVEGEEIEN